MLTVARFSIVLFLFSVTELLASDKTFQQSFRKLEEQVNRDPALYLTKLSATQYSPKFSPRESAYRNTLLAKLYFFRGDIELAKKTFAYAYKQLPNGDDVLLGYWLTYRGWFALEEGRISHALKLVREAKTIFVTNNATEMLVRAKAIEGVLLLWQEDYSTSLNVIESAYIEAKTKSVSNTALTHVYDSLAAYYATLRQYQKGIEYSIKAKETALSQGDVVNALPIYYTLCLTYTRANKLRLADQCYQQMIDLSVLVDAPRYLFWAPAGKARVAIELQDYTEALRLLNIAKGYQQKVIINPAHAIALSNNFARAYLGQGEVAQALEHINETEDILDGYNQPLNNRYRRQTLALKARVFEQQGQFAQAAQALRLYIKLTEEAKETTQLRLEQVARSAFEAKKQQIKLQLADEQLKLQKATLDKLAKEGQLRSAYLIIGLLFFIGISVFTINQQRAYKRSQKRANTDPLTGAYNRRFILDFINDKLLNKQRPFSVAILDIDHFKAINDNYGHDIGDQALIACSQYFSDQIGNSEVQFARFGGEEFIIVMPGFNLNEAKNYVARLCQNLKSHQLTSEKITITGSAGVAEMTSDLTLATVLKKADTMLYEAKNTGRDKVCA